VLESADQALRQKPRQPSIVSSVVKSPPPVKSSVLKIGSESSQSTEMQALSTGSDVRTVVHAKSKDSSKWHHRHTGSVWGKHRPSIDVPSSNGQLLITVTEEDRSAVAHADGGEQMSYQSAISERRESVLDEDQFEPDYDETDMPTIETEHRHHHRSSRKESTSGDRKKHLRHKHHSRHRTSSHSDKADRSKKHKKHKKSSKKHKSSKSKKSDTQAM